MPPPPMPASSSHGSQNGYTPVQSSSGRAASNPGTKIKVNFGEDSFVILLPVNAGYLDLMDRIGKKIRLCGPAASNITTIRIRYKDEDGDLITINSDDDVQMAIESIASDVNSVLTLFTTTVQGK